MKLFSAVKSRLPFFGNKGNEEKTSELPLPATQPISYSYQPYPQGEDPSSPDQEVDYSKGKYDVKYLPPVFVPTAKKTMRVVVISDTHNRHDKYKIPPGDILIHCGDFSANFKVTMKRVHEFNKWLGTHPHPHKIIIGGNHETNLDDKSAEEIQSLLNSALYLQDSGTTIEGIEFYGAPWRISRGTVLYSADAFGLPEEEIPKKWSLIPDSTNVLITHVPPYGVLDKSTIGHVGCPHLLSSLERVQPNVHLYGHVHGARGCVDLIEGKNHNRAINAAYSTFVFDIIPSKP